MSKKPSSPELGHSARKNLTVKIIAVGGAAGNVARHLAAHGLGDLPLAVIDTDCSAAAGEKLAVDAAMLRRLAVTDTAQCRAVLVGNETALKAWLVGADVVFIVTGLGGKTGSALSPIVASMARDAGALVLGFATTPFECEGTRRHTQSLTGLERLRAAADGVICLPNQNILRLIDENTSLLDTFRISNALLAEGMRGVWQLLSYQGLIEIHFEDLRALVRDGHVECLFATAEAAGPNRARDLVEKLLAHPLFDGGRALADTTSALVSLMGGADLTMGEVNRVMEKINRHCDGAQVLMGAAVDEAFRDRLVVTAIITRTESQLADAPAVRPAAEKAAAGMDTHLLNPTETIRPRMGQVPPPPVLPPEKLQELAGKNGSGKGRGRKGPAKLMQEQLPLEIISKGRFDKSEPTIYRGEDLDQPTYIRRGMILN